MVARRYGREEEAGQRFVGGNMIYLQAYVSGVQTMEVYSVVLTGKKGARVVRGRSLCDLSLRVLVWEMVKHSEPCRGQRVQRRKKRANSEGDGMKAAQMHDDALEGHEDLLRGLPSRLRHVLALSCDESSPMRPTEDYRR